jgi:hypothetical protein
MSDRSTLYGSDELETLLHGGSVYEGIFECLRRIWSPQDALEDRNLPDAEYRTRLLERHLTTQDPKAYDELKRRMGDHPITEIDSGCGVIMDALSLREGFQLLGELPDEFGWEVELDWAPVERLPSETKFMAQEWFDAHAPSAVNRDDYQFIGDMEVPQLPGTDPEFVWTRHPDRRLEEAMKGHYSVEEIRDIYVDTKQLIEDLVNESVHDEFLITSDHGYVNQLGGNPYPLTDEQEASLGDKFSGRYTEIEDGYVFENLREAGIIERVGGYYVVQGHYNWTKRGASKRIRHGGFSFIECMTPVLRIRT